MINIQINNTAICKFMTVRILLKNSFSPLNQMSIVPILILEVKNYVRFKKRRSNFTFLPTFGVAIFRLVTPKLDLFNHFVIFVVYIPCCVNEEIPKYTFLI